jgi:hypothetical protein
VSLLGKMSGEQIILENPKATKIPKTLFKTKFAEPYKKFTKKPFEGLLLLFTPHNARHSPTSKNLFHLHEQV